jgi:hypothetical protein
MTTWCMQCATAGVRAANVAVGVDDDGEPACSMHAVKRNDVEVQTNKAKLDAIRRPAPVTQRQIAQPVKENIMNEQRFCKCGCGTEVPASNRFSYINGHRARKPHGHAKLGRPKKAVVEAAAVPGIKAPKAQSLPTLVDLAALRAKLHAQLAAIDLIEGAIGAL